MQALLLSVFLIGISITATAGEILAASADHQKGEYKLSLSVKVRGDRETIYNIVTDHNLLPQLSDIVVESELMEPGDNNVPGTYRHRLVTRVCALLFCFNTVVVEDVWISEQGTIQSIFIPQQSDFIYGESEWQILPFSETQTIINYDSIFKPDFWVPPLIGPIMVKRTMLNSAEQIIQNIESIAASEQLRP